MSFLQIPIQTYPNTSLGYQALVSSVISAPNGIQNSAFGYYALNQNTLGDKNSAFGYEAIRFNSIGDRNNAFGYQSMYDLDNGSDNDGFGFQSLFGNYSGSRNAAFGSRSMFFSLGGFDNASFGFQGLYNINNGSSNSAFGSEALFNSIDGNFNAAFGFRSGYSITTGSKNSILGSYSGNQGGLDIRTLSNYIVLSDGDGNPRLWVDPAGLVTAPGGFAGIGGGITLNNRTSAYTVVASDSGKAINCTSGTFTVSLTAAATLGSGFACFVWNTGTGVITIDPNGAETIDGVSTLTLRQGEGTQIVCDGTNWLTGSKKTMRAYAENIAPGSIRPSATGSGSVAIGNFAQAGGSDSIAIGGLSAAGNAQTLAIGYGTQANPSYSCAIGQNSFGSGSQAATNFGAMALGGSYSSGTDSFSAAIGNNTSTYGARGSNSIAIGYLAISTAVNGISIGTQSNTSATGAVAIGEGAVSTGQYSFSNGYYAVSTIYGKQAYASGRFASSGDAQSGKHVLRIPTTGAVATVLTTNGGAAGTTNQLILSNNSAYAFTGTVVARQQASGGTQSAAWTVEGLIRREANAGTTTLVASTVTAISNAPGWTLALSADTTNGGLAVTATGAAATNIRWVANIDTSEVTYP